MCYFDMRPLWERPTTSQHAPVTVDTSTFAPFIIALSEEDKEAIKAMISEAIREELRNNNGKQ